MENMTRVPYLLEGVREGSRLGHGEVTDGMYRDGFLCPISDMVMGETAERLATDYGIGRDEQDAFALESQRRAALAMASDRFREEIAPVPVPGRKGEVTLVATDEHPRPDSTIEKLAKLPPVFSKTGTVSAGNSSGITDGAAALVVASEARVKELRATPLAWLEEHAIVGVDPHIMGIGPVPAVRELLRKTGGALDAFDLVELNEAFAAQVLAVDRDLRFDRARLNVNGGAIALGHPIGCTGARIVVTLLHEMAKRNARTGLVTLCVSGGLGAAATFRREES
jgi:acetyl-CoA C-acetyltransferase